MKRIMRIVATLCSIALVISMIPASSALAVKGEIWTEPLDGLDYLGGLDPILTLSGDVSTTDTADNTSTSPVWSTPGDGCSYLQGTNIKIKTEGEVLTVTGNGALPDYDYWSQGKRPWANSTCTTLIIDSNITYIGSYEFYKLSNLKRIFICSSTFVNDSTCFADIAYKPIIRVYGSDTTSKKFGNISVTSLESIERMAQTNTLGECFILDSLAAANAFQYSTNPTIHNVYYATDENAPWNDLENNENGGTYLNTCKIASTGVSAAYRVQSQMKFPGNACYEAYGAFIGDYNLGATYNISLYYGSDKITKATSTAMRYTLTIPSELRAAGRTFKLLAIGTGTVYTYDDLDSSSSTITFETANPTTAYALIYK